MRKDYLPLHIYSFKIDGHNKQMNKQNYLLAISYTIGKSPFFITGISPCFAFVNSPKGSRVPH